MSSLASTAGSSNTASLPRSIVLAVGEVPEVFRPAWPEYRGRKWAVEFTTEVMLQCNYWSGGTKYSYRGLDIESGRSFDPACSEYGNPFTHPDVPTVVIDVNRAVLCHKIFCGKDMGLVIYLHPENAAKLLPGPVELDAAEVSALEVVCGTKGGQYRRDAWNRKSMGGEYGPENPVILGLVARGFLKVNRAGAVSATIAGHNARRAG